MSKQLQEEKVIKCKEVFDLFDKNKDGTITTKELGDVMRDLGANPTQAELQEMINEVDKDGSGKIEFKVFLELFGRKKEEKEEKEIYDKNNLPFQKKIIFYFFIILNYLRKYYLIILISIIILLIIPRVFIKKHSVNNIIGKKKYSNREKEDINFNHEKNIYNTINNIDGEEDYDKEIFSNNNENNHLHNNINEDIDIEEEEEEESDLTTKDQNLIEIIKKANKYIIACLEDILLNQIKPPSENIKITSLIPSYNSAKTIKATIKSVQNQKMSDIEILIVDDASTDDSLKMIEYLQKEDPRIRIIKNTENRGPLYSKSLGAKLARGKYIMQIDADDLFINENIFNICYNEAEKNNTDILEFSGFKSKSKLINLKKKPTIPFYLRYKENNQYVTQPELSSFIYKKDEKKTE